MSREYPDRPIVGVGAVVWRGDAVLLIRRGKPPRVGQWSLPGGAQQLGETLARRVGARSARRRGSSSRTCDLLTTVDLIERDADGASVITTRWWTSRPRRRTGEPVAGDDAAAVAWFAAEELADLGLWSETLRIIELAAAGRRSSAVGSPA